MDIYKLLSRSTKLSKNSQIRTAGSQKLPSSGQNGNPQLFGRSAEDESGSGDAEGHILSRPSLLGKRKRQNLQADSVPDGLDFFGAGTTNGSNRHGEIGNLVAESNSMAQEQRGDDGEIEGQGETRAMLQSHKIKITILDQPRPRSDLRAARKSKVKKHKESVSNVNKGRLYPRPLMSFAQLRERYAVSQRLAENIADQGYKLPTEVQLAALPVLMGDSSIASSVDLSNGCNLVAVAPTGSGKTLAFLTPVINAILRDNNAGKEERTRAIVLAPTRELAHQIVNEGKKLVRNTGTRISLMKKGMRLASAGVQEEDLDDGSVASDESEVSEQAAEHHGSIVKSQIIVSTPLVLLNSLRQKNGQITRLSQLRHLVLDEADVLLDPLFREQVQAIWDSCTSPSLTATLWSATMPSSIEEFTMQQLAKSASHGQAPILRLVVGLKDSAVPNLTHTMTYTGSESGKLLALRQLLHPTSLETDAEGRKSLRPPFLVFTQTIDRAKALQAELRYDIPPEAGGSARIAALHSDMGEKAREKVMTDFRKGEVWVIITTDLLARGVDFRGLNGVVNYDVPTSAAAYVHRVGRTGRAGREGGVAVTFYTKEDIPHVKPIANVIAASERLRGKEDADGKLQAWLLDSLPAPTKREKKELKKKGVEERRTGNKSAMITTKSGYERKMDSRRKDMKSARREKAQSKHEAASDGEFAGFSD